MNKKVLLISGVLLTFCLIITIIMVLINDKDTNIYNNKISNNINNGFLTLMLEQDDGSYQESTSNTWPESGYIFNNNLSKCENGSTLTYDEETKTINLKTSISDKCYIYFDKYVLPEILEVSASEITSNSITLTVNALAGTNNIANYYFSINNGVSWVSSTSNSYIFENLESGKTYNIQVYVSDILNYSSKYSSLSETTSDPLIILSATVVGGNETPLYINSVTLNKDVVVTKYVFNDTYELDYLQQVITPWECVVGTQSFSLYVITDEGEVSETYYGTWNAGNAPCETGVSPSFPEIGAGGVVVNE